MPQEAHLIVQLRGHLFAIAAEHVREVTRLPALEAIAEVPPHVVGLFNLRGTLVPVVDLAMRMGYEPPPLEPTQAVVVIARENASTGLIVDRVVGFEALGAEDIEAAPDAPAGVVPTEDAVVRRLARVGSAVATVLDINDVLFRPQATDLRRPGGKLDARMRDLPADVLSILQERATRLARPPEVVEERNATPLVRLRLGGEEFAVAAESALEFVQFGALTPVPCCPAHIAGHVTLRGDIFVAVDLRGLLGLETPREYRSLRAMLVRSPHGSRFAVLIDEVLDVVSQHGLEQALDGSGPSHYIRGSVRSEGRRIPVLDIDRIAAAQELIVKEDT